MPFVQFDPNVLSSYYSSGVSLGNNLLAKRIQQEVLSGVAKVDESVIPPWTLREDQPDDELLQRIYSSGKLIDLNDPRVSAYGDDENFKNLFGLYVGLTKLREIVTYAESGKASSSQLSLLQKRLNNSIAEAKSFVQNTSIDGTTLLFGSKQASTTSTLKIPKLTENTTPVHQGAQVSTVREDPIAGLTGTETFDITVTTAGSSKVVNIDLANVTGALNVDNISSYINGELLSNGIGASITVRRDNETSYAFDVNPGYGETVTFGNPTGQASSVYIAGTNGVGSGSSSFLQKLDDLSAASPTDVFRADSDSVDAADSANAVAVDSQGYVYTVGAASGDLEGQVNQATQDVYLNKYDSAGTLVYSRLLGATEDASGFAVAVDANDDVVVAGAVQGQLTSTSYGGNIDSFVTKFSSAGDELWTRQAAPYADDAATALTTDAAGNIFVAGYARGAVSAGVTHAGASDAYVSKLDSSGNLVYSKQFGGTGDDRATAIAVDNAGSIYVAGEVGGNAVVRKYDDSDVSQTPAWEVDLGALGENGATTGIALGSGGAVYVSGSTSNAALSGSIAQAHSGGMDGFVARIDDAGSSASTNFVSYVGSNGDDTVKGIAVDTSGASDEIYVTGGTTGGVDGNGAAVNQDFYAVKLNDAGAEQFAKQYRGTFSHTGNAIAFDSDGTNVLSRLGLPTGSVPVEVPTGITSLTSARAGQKFTISVNGSEKTIEIAETDSLQFLAFKIKKALGNDGKVTLDNEIDQRELRIEARNGAIIEIGAGPDGFNALPALGLQEVTLFGEPADGEEEDPSVFELGIFQGIDITNEQAAAEAGIILDNALREIRSAYRFLTVGPETEDGKGLDNIQLSEADSEKIANLQSVLTTVTSITNSFIQTNQARLNGQTNKGSTSALFNILA